MKLTVLQENLSKSVGQASKFASSKSQLPILGNLHIKASKTKLSVSSTNLEISILTQIGAKIDEEGEICIPSKVFSELVANLPKENVILETDKEQLKVNTAGFSSTILGMNASDFPKIPDTLNNPFSIDKNSLSTSLSQVIFPTSNDETRPILTGVLSIFDKKQVTFVATDGFRLSLKKIDQKTDTSITDSKKVVVPKNVLSELCRSLDNVDEVLVDIQDTEKQIVFSLGDSVLSSRLLEGDFPDFEKIIPKESFISVVIDKEDMLRSVKLASIFAREAANIVKISIKKESVKIFAESGNSGNQETEVEAKVECDTKDFTIAFNYHFLEDFLHSVSGDDLKMEFTTTDKAGIFTDPKDPNYLHLIMPVRV